MKSYDYVPRKRYFRSNKYQKPIIALVIVPNLLITISITAFVLYFHREIIDIILYATHPPSTKYINQWAMAILIVVWSFFVVIVLAAYSISSNLVGAFERIIRELDQIVTKGEYKPIRARPKDTLANELCQRINALVEQISGPNTSGDEKGRF